MKATTIALGAIRQHPHLGRHHRLVMLALASLVDTQRDPLPRYLPLEIGASAVAQVAGLAESTATRILRDLSAMDIVVTVVAGGTYARKWLDASEPIPPKMKITGYQIRRELSPTPVTLPV